MYTNRIEASFKLPTMVGLWTRGYLGLYVGVNAPMFALQILLNVDVLKPQSKKRLNVLPKGQSSPQGAISSVTLGAKV
jgi:hypothetical protein